MKKANLILLRGYPGSGKTTIGTLLAHREAGIFIDHNQLLNTICGMVSSDKGLSEEIHRLELGMARQVLMNGASAIIARGFTKQTSIEPYLQVAEETGSRIIVIRLSVPMGILIERVGNESRNANAMSINDPEELKEWASQHPLESIAGEIVLDASIPPARVADEIIRQL